jgi:hypothetical protein
MDDTLAIEENVCVVVRADGTEVRPHPVTVLAQHRKLANNASGHASLLLEMPPGSSTNDEITMDDILVGTVISFDTGKARPRFGTQSRAHA